MDDEILNGVIETIDSAKEHQLKLSERLTALALSKTQVTGSAKSSRRELEAHFDKLKKQVVSTLDRRLEVLLGQVDHLEQKSLTPLFQCEELIQSNMATTASILNQGKALLSADHESAKDTMTKFKDKSKDIALSSLPEVPLLSDVACILVSLPEVLAQQLLTDVTDYGRVMCRPPVQFTSIEERPGSLLVNWSEVEEDDCPEHADLTEFCLQYHYGEENDRVAGSTFTDAYVGPNTSFILRHLRPLVPYTFRVRGRADGAVVWSPWSETVAAMTTVQHYEWQEEVPGFLTSNENKISERVASDEENSTLYSKGSAYTCGQSIVFKVLEAGGALRRASMQMEEEEKPATEGVALTVTDNCPTLLGSGVIFVSTDGRVFIDGQEKLTKLPALKRSSVLSFDTETLTSGKVRVSIEVDEKIVTFDWSVDQAAQTNEGLPSAIGMAMGQAYTAMNLNFAMKFDTLGWKLCVE